MPLLCIPNKGSSTVRVSPFSTPHAGEQSDPTGRVSETDPQECDQEQHNKLHQDHFQQPQPALKRLRLCAKARDINPSPEYTQAVISCLRVPTGLPRIVMALQTQYGTLNQRAPTQLAD